MEDIMKALLDVVRAQHSATEGSEEKPFDINDIIDMAMNITGRPEELKRTAELSDTIQKMAESMAPDIFPPKTFEEMDDSERAASAVNMIEERLKNGGRRREEAQQPVQPVQAPEAVSQPEPEPDSRRYRQRRFLLHSRKQNSSHLIMKIMGMGMPMICLDRMM